jgi:hypothetical protein
MNLKELDSFKLSDAVTFHDHLNPALWAGHKLKPAIKEQLLIIAKDFLENNIPNDSGKQWLDAITYNSKCIKLKKLELHP